MNIQLAALGTQIILPKPKIQEQKPILHIPKPKQKNSQIISVEPPPPKQIIQIKPIKNEIKQKPKQIKKIIPQPVTQDIIEQPLSYVIIRTVNIKQKVGEVIVNYKNQSGCLKIYNRVLSFVDVNEYFKSIDNIEQRQLKCVDTQMMQCKNEKGWIDCIDCEEYMLE